ncbi:hypothetical protein DFJ77DRAFT_513813 [Powellomyces hirtus]|nr:hypothetical protein DFJ77DRAFT_513813 [Powellomyces hirtus]
MPAPIFITSAGLAAGAAAFAYHKRRRSIQIAPLDESSGSWDKTTLQLAQSAPGPRGDLLWGGRRRESFGPPSQPIAIPNMAQPQIDLEKKTDKPAVSQEQLKRQRQGLMDPSPPDADPFRERFF